MIREIEADAKAHGDERRTLIEAQKRAVAEVRVVDEPVTVVVSMKGWVRALKGHEVDAGQLAFKAGDALYGTFGCRSVDTLLVFGSNGRVYSVAGGEPAERSRRRPADHVADRPRARHAAGALLRRRADDGAAARRHRRLRPARARVGDLLSRQRGGKSFLALEGDEKPLPPAIVARRRTTRVACLTLAGRLLVFGLDELKLQGNGGRGLTLVDLDAKDARRQRRRVRRRRCASKAAAAAASRARRSLRGAALEPYVGRRARKGRRQDAIPKAMRVVAGDPA